MASSKKRCVCTLHGGERKEGVSAPKECVHGHQGCQKYSS